MTSLETPAVTPTVIRPLVVALATLASLGATATDWPVPHQNSDLTRAVEASSNMTTPSFRWRRFLGGVNPPTVVGDLTGDGDNEVAMIVGGALVCRVPETGALLWATPTPSG